MKTKLLLLALAISAFGYSQFDNIPTGSGYYINKLIASPSGSDLTNELIEVRGPANAVVPSDLYFISIEGDGNSNSRGKVSEAISLGNGVRTFGANGIMAIVCNYTDENTNVVTTNAYSALMDSDATVLVIELTGDDVTGSSSSNVSTQTPDIGYDGNLIDPCATYMIVSAPSNPKGDRIDGTTDSSDCDGIINTGTGGEENAHLSWVLYDSIGYMDDDDNQTGETGEFAYGQIVYAQNNANTDLALRFITTSATVVDFATTSDANYFLRQGASTGHTAGDWVASANGSGSSVPNWVFSTSSEKCYPDAFLGWSGINLVYGALNPTAASLSSQDFLASKFRIYPNPVKNIININSNNIEVSAVKIYDFLGKEVLSQKGLASKEISISHLNSGMYLLNITTNKGSLNKKILVD